MEVHVKFIGIPEAVKAVGKKEITTQIEQPTLGDLLRKLNSTYGAPLSSAILTDRGDVDEAIQILHNGASFLDRRALGQHLDNGDHVTFMMMMAPLSAYANGGVSNSRDGSTPATIRSL